MHTCSVLLEDAMGPGVLSKGADSVDPGIHRGAERKDAVHEAQNWRAELLEGERREGVAPGFGSTKNGPIDEHGVLLK